jgi:hypothetical protein
MANLDDTDDVRKILETAHAAVVDGEIIIERAREDHGLNKPLDDDGPPTRAWKQRDPSAEPPPSAMNVTLIEMIGHIVDYENAGRGVAAGLGLTRLRQHYEGFDSADLPPDEQSWEAFAAKHLPLPQIRVAELIGKLVHHGGLLRCTKCGTKSKCECNCGAPYVGEHHWAMSIEKADDLAKAEPAKESSALNRAAAAIAANPEKSNRAIAAEIGVAEPTVRRARNQRKIAGDDDAPDDAPDKRVGRDGRSYPVARTTHPPVELDYDLIQETHPDVVTTEQRWQWSALSLFRDLIAVQAYWKRQFGDWQKFRPPDELIALMDQASSAMQTLTSDLERRKA